MKHDTGFGASFPCNIKLDIAINFNHQMSTKHSLIIIWQKFGKRNPTMRTGILYCYKWGGKYAPVLVIIAW